MVSQLKNDRPHYFLSIQSGLDKCTEKWQFTIKQANGAACFRVSDTEPGVSGERLELLTIVRAMESLDQPARITLTSCSKYIQQGMQYNIYEWKSNNWLWEFFGYMVPVKHADLWRRMEHLLEVHSVECRHLRVDERHNSVSKPKMKEIARPVKWNIRTTAENWIKYAMRLIPQTIRYSFNMATHIVC